MLALRRVTSLADAIEQYYYRPDLFVRQVIGATPEPWQVDVMTALITEDKIAIRSGHGVGKSALMSWIVFWWLMTRYPAKVAITAPTAHQLQDVLWGELSKWQRNIVIDYFKRLAVVKSDRVEIIGAENESFAVARTARKENPEAFQGFHATHMLFLVDEASGVEDIIFEVGEGAMSTAGAKTLMVGNPTRTSGYFYDAFHKMRSHWWTRKVGCEESSRVTRDFIDSMSQRYGRDSNVFRVRVLGDFPTSEDDTVIPLELAESALERDIETIGSSVIWGLDVARFGSDRTALAKRKGNTQLEKVKAWQGLDLMQTAGRVVAEYEDTPDSDKPEAIAVDIIGLGAGVYDRLAEMGLPVVGINVGEQPAIQERYMRLRDELWFKSREWLAERNCKLCDDALVAELTLPKYKYQSNGKIQVESKDEMKKRGVTSPDLADAWNMTLAVGGGVSSKPRQRIKRESGSWRTK
jgi:hypothetical protein